MTDDQLEEKMRRMIDQRKAEQPPSRSVSDVLTKPMQFAALIATLAIPAVSTGYVAVTTFAQYKTTVDRVSAAQSAYDEKASHYITKDNLKEFQDNLEMKIQNDINDALDRRFGQRYGSGAGNGR